MATKKIDEKKTLKYAVAFYFCTSGKINFMLGNKMYQHINTVYDQREDGRGFNTCEVVYNYKAQKYEVLNVDTDGKSSVSCPLKPSDSAPLKHSTMPP